MIVTRRVRGVRGCSSCSARLRGVEEDNYARNKSSIWWFWGGLGALVGVSLLGMVIADRPKRRR